jgi:glycosyltransferase involved in cell wall biosynthesis
MKREFEGRGLDVVVFAMSHPDNAESPYSKYFVSNIDYNNPSRGIIRRIKEAIDIVYSLEARHKLSNLLEDTKPDICHAHNIYHQLSPSIFSALRKAGIPTVLTLHDGKLLCANMLFLRNGKICERCAGSKFYHAVLGKCIKDSYASSLVCAVEETVHRFLKLYERGVDLFITPSNFLKQKLVEHGRLKECQIEVLPNYADVRMIEPCYEPGNYGLFVGRLEPLKGVATLLKACEQVPDFEVRLAGRGPMLEQGLEFAKSKGLSKIKFLGFQTGSDLQLLFRDCRFVVLPSECYENCPMVVLEAFAAGKPVIASRIGGIPELVDHGEDGLLFEPGNSEELAKCMRMLIDNKALAEEMGRKGRAKAEAKFSLEYHIDSLIGIYSRLLSSR